MENTNCAFLVEDGKCFVLSKYCDNCYTCKFYKTEKELELSRKDAEERLRKKGLKRVTKKDSVGREYISTAPLKGGEN